MEHKKVSSNFVSPSLTKKQKREEAWYGNQRSATNLSYEGKAVFKAIYKQSVK